MRSISEFDHLYIHKKFVDLRKNINGLIFIVQEEMKLNLKSNSVFIFTNRKKSHMKIVYFDKNGFCLWLKRLEESKFPWPKELEADVIEVSKKDMLNILDGINIWTKFKDVYFETVV
jgi:transposase